VGCADVERIARLVLRDYGLPLTLRTVSMEPNGECRIEFADAVTGRAVTSVGIWCDAKVSPYGVRESLKRALQVVG